jgi:hypothetical protein
MEIIILSLHALVGIVATPYAIYLLYKMFVSLLKISNEIKPDVQRPINVRMNSMNVILYKELLTNDGLIERQSFTKYLFRFLGTMLLVIILWYLSGSPR